MSMALKWYRSWPDNVPGGRAYVQDRLPRLVMSDANYDLVEGGLPSDEPGFCMLEWDVALAREERILFAAIAARNPDRILVAPYFKAYGPTPMPVCIHRMKRPPRFSGTYSERWGPYVPIEKWTTKADLFGFGCIYFPQVVLRKWQAIPPAERPKAVSTPPGHFGDTEFSLWHRKNYGLVDVTWVVRPQHLHGD